MIAAYSTHHRQPPQPTFKPEHHGAIINTESQTLRSCIGNAVAVVGRGKMALTGSVRRSNFQGVIYSSWCRKQFKSCFARQHCFIILPTELGWSTRLGMATGGHCQLQILEFSPTLRLLPDCLLIFSLKLTFKIYIYFFPFPKPARIFIAASWQHFVRDGSLVLECLKAVFQTPGVSLTLYHTEADEDSGVFQGHLCSCTWTPWFCLETGRTQSFGKTQVWTPKPPLFAASLPQC